MQGDQQKRTRLIRISSTGVELVPGYLVRWTTTNLPAEDFTIHASHSFIWRVHLGAFDRETGHLELDVVDYYPLDTTEFDLQTMKHTIRSLDFGKLDWYYLGGFLSSYKKIRLLPFINDNDHVYIPDNKQSEFNYRLNVPVKDMEFIHGAISCWTELPALPNPVEIKVVNEHIIPQFTFIKSYFTKALGKKSVSIQINLKMVDDRILSLHAKSKDIECINESMVGTLRHTRILEIQKSPKVIIVDKHLFNADEVFDQYYDEPDANLFQQNVQDIIDDLQQLGLVRNRKQLEYLAGRKQLSGERILITLAPNLGFLFINTTTDKNHFIWELVNSHATFVWSFDRWKGDMTAQIKSVEHMIGLIREQGREHYKSYYQSQITDLPYTFTRIVHRHADRSIIDPFPGWKHRLEEALV
ncbi:MAG: hypothetical protein KDC53_20470 [Saprospiraceae bacterium]|nr:hypothetical protein [Saprospiraceae bacterium]